MSTRTLPVRYEYHVAVIHPREDRVLLLPGVEGWRLPHFAQGERHVWQDVAHVNQGLREVLGVSATTLRCLAIDYRREAEVVSKLYAAVPRDPSWRPPPGGRWVAREEVGVLPLEVEGHRRPLSEWFAWYAGAPRQRAPWYLPGWHEAATRWATEQLTGAGMPPTGPAEQLRSWQRSAILRLPTTEGAVYLKAVPPIFAYEPALTAVLAAADPARFPRPVAVDPGRGWLLMRELRGPTLDTRCDDVELWERALATFAEVQIASSAHLPALRAAGAPERPLATLAARLAPLLADPDAGMPASPAGLSADERRRLHALAARLEALTRRLAAYDLPATIEHGDFWAGQVVVTGAGFAFLDWSDSSISHPFFSPLLFLVEIEDFFPRLPGVRERLRDAYLRPWAELLPGRDLVAAFELAQPLAALHHASTYHGVVLPNIELKWEMELMLPFYLKMALRLAEPLLGEG